MNGTPPALVATLRAHAQGIPPAEAAIDLLIAHSTWLHRADFRTRFVRILVDGTDEADISDIDWPAAIAALNAGDLPCSGSEQQILRLTASLADGIPVDLRDSLTGLDQHNSDRVITAVSHATGHRQASPPQL